MLSVYGDRNDWNPLLGCLLSNCWFDDVINMQTHLMGYNEKWFERLCEKVCKLKLIVIDHYSALLMGE